MLDTACVDSHKPIDRDYNSLVLSTVSQEGADYALEVELVLAGLILAIIILLSCIIWAASYRSKKSDNNKDT